MAMKLRPSHPLGQPLGSLAGQLRAVPSQGVGVGDVRVTGVTLRGQDAEAGDLFAALPGATSHGGHYVDEAVRRGAVAVLTDAAGLEHIAADVGVPVLIHPAPRSVLGELAATVYGHPSDASCGSSASPGRPARRRPHIWWRPGCARRTGWPG